MSLLNIFKRYCWSCFIHFISSCAVFRGNSYLGVQGTLFPFQSWRPWSVFLSISFVFHPSLLISPKFHLKRKNSSTNELDVSKFLVTLGSVMQPDSAILIVYKYLKVNWINRWEMLVSEYSVFEMRLLLWKLRWKFHRNWKGSRLNLSLIMTLGSSFNFFEYLTPTVKCGDWIRYLWFFKRQVNNLWCAFYVYAV